jgi:hypothetical protein
MENIIVIYPDGSEFACQFSIAHFYRQILMPRYSAHLISLDLLLSYINCCTAHHSSVMFWIWFCLKPIKAIALAHLAIISTCRQQHFEPQFNSRGFTYYALKFNLLPWRRGIVVIVSVTGTEDRGFESRQGVTFLRSLYIAMLFLVILWNSF